MIEVEETHDPVAKMNRLIEFDLDAVAAYEAAIYCLKKKSYRDELTRFKNDYQRHINLLSLKIRNQGGQPIKGKDGRRLLSNHRLLISDLSSDEAILRAIEANTCQMQQAYDKAVRDVGGSEALHYLLIANIKDKARHRTWLEQTLSHLKH